MTEACSQIQQMALEALRGPNPPDYVAVFGNTPVESVGDWFQILGIYDSPPNVRIAVRMPSYILVLIIIERYWQLIYTQAPHVDYDCRDDNLMSFVISKSSLSFILHS